MGKQLAGGELEAEQAMASFARIDMRRRPVTSLVQEGAQKRRFRPEKRMHVWLRLPKRLAQSLVKFTIDLGRPDLHELMRAVMRPAHVGSAGDETAATAFASSTAAASGDDKLELRAEFGSALRT
ncbi:hypothetical protein [Mesorhizobium sp.]|uniref:hypothetical protein n=1 Tax=Mesorhizobium sp. TaxID=1871066 RepID=UPI0025C534DE|nr:hypothetical protein [Mesorhizobium sp.]